MNKTDDISYLFEPDAVADMLRQSLPFSDSGLPAPTDVWVRRYWPRRREKLLMEWSFALGEHGRCTIFGQVGSLDQTGRFGQVARKSMLRVNEFAGRLMRISPNGLSGAFATVPEENLVLHSPDCDSGLSQLPVCLDADIMADEFASAVAGDRQPLRGGGSALTCRLVSYRPSRRATIQYATTTTTTSTQETRTIGKLFRDDRGAGLLQLHTDINEQLRRATDGRVRVPAPIRYLSKQRLLLFSWASGVDVTHDASRMLERSTMAVEALAALHGVDVTGLRAYTVADECKAVRRWLDFLGQIDPSLHARCEPVAQAVYETAATVKDGPTCTIHRDFYEAQVRIAPGSVTILDLDTMATGSPCVDLGNFLAHLSLLAIRRRTSKDGFPGARRLVDQYQRQAGLVDSYALRFYLATSLLRLAAVHGMRSGSSGVVDALLGQAVTALSGAIRGPARVAV